jgi:Family of unknown function (DUF5999)
MEIAMAELRPQPRPEGPHGAHISRRALHPPRPDRDAAYTLAFHPEQGWSLLCNGVTYFVDTFELLPDGRVVPPHRPGGIQARATDRRPR